MKRVIFTLLLILLSAHTWAQIKYPTTRTEPFDTLIYTKKISDPFFRMSRKANEPEMKSWVSAQGKLTQSILDSIPGATTLSNEINNAYLKMQDEI